LWCRKSNACEEPNSVQPAHPGLPGGKETREQSRFIETIFKISQYLIDEQRAKAGMLNYSSRLKKQKPGSLSFSR
jgi:hypothetical protein